MIVQIIIAFYGTVVGTAAVGAGIEKGVKGWKANEEKYLQTNLNWEKWLEEEKKAEHEIETIKLRRSEYKKCCCKETREHERIIETVSCFYHHIFKYAHWLREKTISVEAQKEELETLIENVRAVLKVVEDTYQHEKAEWELNKDQSEDYEVIDKVILELEQETSEWQKILTELESKLSNLQASEQQTQIIQPVFNWNNN